MLRSHLHWTLHCLLHIRSDNSWMSYLWKNKISNLPRHYSDNSTIAIFMAMKCEGLYARNRNAWECIVHLGGGAEARIILNAS
jgi:hypothetical protein